MKKRIIASALALCMTMPMTAIVPVNIATAEMEVSFTPLVYDIYQYIKYSDHVEIYATSTATEGRVEIPKEINGLPVTAIGDHGLAGLSKVTSIYLPDSITTIGKQAFYGDTALEDITLCGNITEIPDEAFINCMSLKDIDLPKNLTSIGERAFYGCSSLTKINIPDSVTEISKQAFDSCTGLTSVEIPKEITVVNDGVFMNCKGITKMVLPENVTSVGTKALPSSLESLCIENPDCDLSQLMTSISSKKCTLYVMEGSTGVSFAEMYGYNYEILQHTDVAVSGDVNNDNEFNIADLVTMQKYLLGNGSLEEWLTGDMNNDGTVDIFDYIEMLRQFRRENPEYDIPVELFARNLTADIQSNDVIGAEADSEFTLSQIEFAFNVFRRELLADENTLVSPYSIMQALSMTANGARGETKTEMESVLGMPVDSLNKYLYTFRTSQHNDSNSKLSTANSIWAKNDVNVNRNFLQNTADYYNADFFIAPFDQTTLTDINNWVNENTDRMIPEILDEIDDSAVTYLINAVAFDAKWETEFDKNMTVKADFTTIGNTVQQADMMRYFEYGSAFYLTDENAEGIYKYYKDRKYAFVAMLPDENISVNDYIAGLTAEKFTGLLAEPCKEYAGVEMPKFSYDFDTLLNNTLINMGMPTAFDKDNADLMNMFDFIIGNPYINRVIHKTHIDVDEAGTKAAAATTVVEVNCNCIMEQPKTVTFNRPFVYFIIDTETNIPIFMGTLMDVQS